MTLEKGKHYGLQEKTQTLLDLSRNRLNGATPHQAPQRERVSQAQIPGAASRAARRRTKRWIALLHPDRNMGVPQLMLILEPNIVWDHTKSWVGVLGKEVEAQYCPGDFFEGWHRAGRFAHGVYEGNYWELLGDCDEMIDMLKKMAKAPALLEEPVLELPAQADLPKWDDYKPVLQALPSAPTLPTLRLPPFRAPILETEIPFIEPELAQLPDVPDHPEEEPTPIFFPPEELKVEQFLEPDYFEPEPPVVAEAPHAPVFGKPQYGHDWTGTRPFTLDEPKYVDPKPLIVPTWVHPPRSGLPRLPLLEELQMDRADLDLDPIPRLELAWECGPDPEPSYASMSTTPKSLSRPNSPPRSRPVSAGPTPSWHTTTPFNSSRPTSAAPSVPSSHLQATPRPSTPSGIRGEPSQGPATPAVASRPSSAALVAPAKQRSRPSTPGQLSRQPSAKGAEPEQSGTTIVSAEPAAPEQELWEQVTDVDAGKPRVWLNFDKPFAELPPVFMPPRPELGVCNGPEPLESDFPAGDLEEEPIFVLPREREEPVWNEPELKAPRWMPPCEPRPIGFMRGTAPVLIIDVSGTMNPRQRGKFNEMKDCVCELLDPNGELATAAAAFDVIAYCNNAWAWSATYASRMSLLASSQIYYSGRQQGGKIRPGSSRVADKTGAGAQMMPTEPELLADAQNWVAKWPEAVGRTHMLSSFRMADDHWNSDCWYIFSDGQAHDPSACIDFLEARIRHGQRVPVVHTVGFFPDDAPEHFEGRRYLQRLSAMTGGTYQEYDPKLQRIYQDGVGFVDYDPSSEAPEETGERLWAEEQLRAERKKNIRLGIIERLDVTMARVQAMHGELRVKPVVREHQERTARERAEHEAAVDEVRAYNADLAAHARAEHDAAVAALHQRNQDREDAARGAFEEAYRQWYATYELAVQEWEAQKATLEKDRAVALAQYQALQASRSRTASPQHSRPTSARPAGHTSRPTSARPMLPSGGSRPTSATPVRSRPTSAVPATAAQQQLQQQSAMSASRPASGRPQPIPEGSAATAGASTGMAMYAMAATGAWGDAAPTTIPTTTAQLHQQATTFAPAYATPEEAAAAAGATGGLRPMSGRAGSASRPSSARPLSSSSKAAGASISGYESVVSGQPLIPEGDDEGEVEQLPVDDISLAAAGGEGAAAAASGPRIRALSSSASMNSRGMRPGSGRAIASRPMSSSARPLSGRQLASAGSAAFSEAYTAPLPEEDGEDAGIVDDEEYDEFGDELGLPSLELEDSQELKRRIFPHEVVKALDDENTHRLEEIRDEWSKLLAETESRNRKKLELLSRNQSVVDKYAEDVVACYADSFVRDAIMGAAVRTAANELLHKNAKSAYEAEVARVVAENARLARLHTAEVEEKLYKEQQYKMALERWERDRTAAWAQHEHNVVAAKQAHEENVVTAQREWEAHKEEVEQMNVVRLKEAENMHARLVEEVAAINRRYKQEHMDKIKARKAVEAANLALLAEAKAAHATKLEELARDNEERLVQAQKDHQELCARLSVEHEEGCRIASREFEELRVFLAQHNEALTEEARKKYQEAVAAAQAEHDARCAELRAAHEAELARVRQHNEEIWPRVQVARLALAELGRVQAFAEHIRFCANKYEMGVNFMPNTPNYDRVVEMQALNEALMKAFPEYAPQDYPWPDHERKGEAGTGWVPSPQPKSLTYKDPAAEIQRIATGRASASGAKPRPASAKRAATTPSRTQAWEAEAVGVYGAGATVTTVTTRTTVTVAQQGPEGEGAADVAAAAAASGSPASGQQLLEAAMVQVRPSTAPAAQRPLSAGRQRFSSVYAQQQAQGAATAGAAAAVLAANARPARPASASGTRTGPGALSSDLATTAMRRAAAATTGGAVSGKGDRPGSASPRGVLSYTSSPAFSSPAFSPADSPRPGSPALGGRPSSAGAHKGVVSRPASARPVVPARMSVELGTMQSTMAKFKSSTSFKPVLAGFVKDLPRLKYPEVDVRALDV